MQRYLLLVLFIFACACSAPAADRKVSLGQFLGEYEIIGFEKYAGGVTTDQVAKGFVGSRVTIKPNIFMIREQTIKNPVYRIDQVPVDRGEGSVPRKDLSNFYGFKTGRVEIVRLLVFESAEDREPYEALELISPGLLVNMYDGRLYFIEAVFR